MFRSRNTVHIKYGFKGTKTEDKPKNEKWWYNKKIEGTPVSCVECKKTTGTFLNITKGVYIHKECVAMRA